VRFLMLMLLAGCDLVVTNPDGTPHRRRLGWLDLRIQGWTSTLMSNPTLWHAQFRRQLPSSNKVQRRQLATPLNAP
jgi:hypothetical protein